MDANIHSAKNLLNIIPPEWYLGLVKQQCV